MITIIDVIRALSDVVESVTGSPPTTKDVTEAFGRPCTWIRPLTINPELVRGLRGDYIEMEMVYFAQRSWEGWRTLLQVQEAFAEVLTEPILVQDGFAIYLEDLAFEPSRQDMTLSCTFNLQNYQLVVSASNAAAPNMEYLEVAGKAPDGDTYEEIHYGETEIVVTGKSAVKEYTGSEQSVSGYTTSDYDTAITLTGPAQDSAKATATGTEVGTYTMALASSDFSATSAKYSVITITVIPGTLEITEPETQEE